MNIQNWLVGASKKYQEANCDKEFKKIRARREHVLN